jgi:hypothetical protein
MRIWGVRRLGALALLAALLPACGGGGAGNNSAAPSDGGSPSGVSGEPIVPTQHPKVLLNQAGYLTSLQQQLSSKVPAATRFQAMVDSELAHAGTNYAFQAWFAALMYQITGQTRYADFAVSKADAFLAGEEALIKAGQAPTVAHDSYLDVGPLVGDVALVYDWCNARLTASQRTRWVAYMNQAVANVWDPVHASWGGKVMPWSGWSISNPSNNYYYSFLKATMLLGLATDGENTQASAWRTQFRQAKIAAELVPTFNRDLLGGGSREGTGYGTAMKNLFQLYDWWERSTGERLADLTPHTKASQAWMLHAMVPTLDRLAAIGDQSRDSSVSLFDYHREYLLALGALYPQERMSGAAKSVLDASSLPQIANGFELFADYLYAVQGLPAVRQRDLSTAYWGEGTGHFFMRSAWGDKSAAYALFTCGPYTESHAHRDQGAFQLFRDEWLAPTSNIYTHSGIQQGEEQNNLVRVIQNGSTIAQGFGQSCQMRALVDNALFSYGQAQITPMYMGKTAVTQVERAFLFIKPATFIVFDRVGSAAGTQRVWTLNVPGTATASGDRLTVMAPGGHQLDVYRVAPADLSYQITSPSLSDGDTWLTQPKRIEVSDTAGTQTLFLHIMGTGGSVSSAVRSDAAGQTGAQVSLSDGRRVLVRFANDTGGGTLQIQQASGTVLFGGALPTTVVPPAVFAN